MKVVSTGLCCRAKLALGAIGILGVVAVVVAACARAQPQESERQAETDLAAELQAAQDALIESLIRHGYLKTPRVIQAMRDVKRHLFVPRELWKWAYGDHPLPIGHDQTISAPSIVALMTELIEPGPEKTVLEVGTGSGYQAAVLSLLCKHVYTIEIVEPLATRAVETLKQLGYKNVTVRCGDGYRGWPEHAPFDGIMVTCAPEEIPQPLVDQLREGGRMVIPAGPMWEQQLYVLRKVDGRVERQAVLPVMFVPMTGEAQGEPR